MEAYEYRLKVPLQEMVLRKVSIILWNRFCYDSLSLLSARQTTVEILVEKMKELVTELSLPNLIRDKLIYEIINIVAEMHRWWEYHRSFLPPNIVRSALHQLNWTCHGTLDYLKTAEKLLRQEQLDSTESFKLSCLYCFEADIQKFWLNIPQHFKTRLHNDFRYRFVRNRTTLVTFWTLFLNGDEDLLTSAYEGGTLNQFAFMSAAVSGNKIASEFFFQKLTFQEKEASLMYTAEWVIRKSLYAHAPRTHDFPKESTCHVVSYLLSQMSKDQQIDMFKMYPCKTLICFLNYPWQDLFVKISELMWTFIPFHVYEDVITSLSNSSKITAFNHQTLFREFFLKSSINYRNDLFLNRSLDEEHIIYEYRIIRIHYTPPQQMEWFKNLILTNNSESIKLVAEKH